MICVRRRSTPFPLPWRWLVLACVVGQGWSWLLANNVAPQPPRSLRIDRPFPQTTIRGKEFSVSGIAEGFREIFVVLRDRQRQSFWTISARTSVRPDGRFDVSVDKLGGDATDVDLVVLASRQSHPTARIGRRLATLPAKIDRSESIALEFVPPAMVAAENRRLEIVHPRAGDRVGRHEGVLLRDAVVQQPLVFVRVAATDQSPAGLWYVSSQVQAFDARQKVADVTWGAASGPSLQEYEFCVGVIDDDAERVRWMAESPMRDLPDGVQTTEPFSVVLDRTLRRGIDADRMRLRLHLANRSAERNRSAMTPALPTARIVDPKEMQAAIFSGVPVWSVPQRRVPMVGRHRGDRPIVVLIRGGDDADHWYVQPTCQYARGFFRCETYVGSEAGPPGSQFECVAISPLDAAAAATLHAGQSLRTLPPRWTIEDVVLLRRQ